MIRWFEATLICLMVAGATATYWIKHDSRNLASEIRVLEQRIHAEQTAIELKKAEWGLLTQPERLAQLTELHGQDLKLDLVTPEQFQTLDQLDALLDQVAPNSIEDALSGAGIDLEALAEDIAQ